MTEGTLEQQLRALSAAMRERGIVHKVKPPGSKVTLAELNGAHAETSQAYMECADELDTLVSRLSGGGAQDPFLPEAIELFLDAIIAQRGCNDHAWLNRCARDIRQALSDRSTPAAGAQGWQDIASAPKDGTEVLCTWVHTLPDGSCHWSGVMHVLAYFPDWLGAGKGAWVLDGDFETRFLPNGIHETPPIDAGAPTHWHPLPSFHAGRIDD